MTALLTFNESDGEIWFMPCRYDGTLVDGRNPFTREAIRVPLNGSLTSDEQRAVEAVVERARAPGVSNVVEVSDGGTALLELRPSSAMLRPYKSRPTPGLAALVYDVLVAGRWCIRADEVLVVTDAEHACLHAAVDETIPQDVIVVDSATAMASVLGWTTCN